MRRGSSRMVTSRTLPHTGFQLGRLAGGGLFQERMARALINGSVQQNLPLGLTGKETANSSRLLPSVPSEIL